MSQISISRETLEKMQNHLFDENQIDILSKFLPNRSTTKQKQKPTSTNKTMVSPAPPIKKKHRKKKLTPVPGIERGKITLPKPKQKRHKPKSAKAKRVVISIGKQTDKRYTGASEHRSPFFSIGNPSKKQHAALKSIATLDRSTQTRGSTLLTPHTMIKQEL